LGESSERSTEWLETVKDATREARLSEVQRLAAKAKQVLAEDAVEPSKQKVAQTKDMVRVHVGSWVWAWRVLMSSSLLLLLRAGFIDREQGSLIQALAVVLLLTFHSLSCFGFSFVMFSQWLGRFVD